MERKLLHNSPISCFADEIDSSVDKQIALLKELGISWIEFRSGDGKGVADYTAKRSAGAAGKAGWRRYPHFRPGIAHR